ncbi:hypothetical protein MRX96_043094 [Rhipicephalus microplus]
MCGRHLSGGVQLACANNKSAVAGERSGTANESNANYCVGNHPTPRRRAFSTADSNDWTTTNLANTAAVTADDFPNRTNLADKTNAI